MKKYRTRNGAVVVVDKRRWSAGVRCIEVGESSWTKGTDHCLDKSSEDPLTWTGGAWGSGFDIVNEVKEPTASRIVTFLKSLFKAADK